MSTTDRPKRDPRCDPYGRQPTGKGRPRKWHRGNAHEAQQILNRYYWECEAKEQTPHIAGCAYALGLTITEWTRYEREYEDVPDVFRDALKDARSRCLRDLTTGLIDGKTTPVGKIFIGKALYGLRDGSEDDNRHNGPALQVVINTTPEALGMQSGQVIDVQPTTPALPINDAE